ncbi:hypothetical protein RUMCAL_00721 [Ruminococcus callidus ATCC 27760]|uniref:Uncharacterized protein n=1 Tax=Ruminococcus callidus ATCC 27760 TaxID=411473 RepID=U2MC79_9FIRM|nr:hypothetical protein RUMCAL_00721 [Ruminococcus callidus ATCC 27760]
MPPERTDNNSCKLLYVIYVVQGSLRETLHKASLTALHAICRKI